MKTTIEGRRLCIVNQASQIVANANRVIQAVIDSDQRIDKINLAGLIDVNTEFNLLWNEMGTDDEDGDE